MIRKALLCLTISMLMAATAMGQENIGKEGRGTISATVFGDYYWIASSHREELDNNNGFWFRRIYLTHEYEISPAFSTRLRLEMSSEGDFVSDAKMSPVVKDAYLRWSRGGHAITAGISSTPTFGLVEDTWGYRAVEKSPLDLYDFGSSRDFGLSFKGSFGREGNLGYHFMFGNGNSNSTELNKGKKFMLSLSYWLTDQLVIEAYGDWNDRSGNTDTYTTQAFIGFQGNTVNVGALYAYQYRSNTAFSGDMQMDLVSFFANSRLSESVKGFVRVDHLFDPNPAGPGNDYLPMSDRAESTFLTGGVDVALDEHVHLMPNIEAVVYGVNEAGVRPDTDLIPRLTLLFTF